MSHTGVSNGSRSVKTKSISQRTEIRDGRVFKVFVLPEVKPRRVPANKVGGGKRYARSVKLATITQPLRVCPSCKRQRPITSFLKRGKKGPTHWACYACRTAIAGTAGKKSTSGGSTRPNARAVESGA
jgi:ribosomal protein L37AE/L43A